MELICEYIYIYIIYVGTIPKTLCQQLSSPRPKGQLQVLRQSGWLVVFPQKIVLIGYYSYGHLLVTTGYKWDYTFYKWGYKYL